MPSKITCPECGSVYELKEFKIPVRDNDSIDCEVYGKKDIFAWNEAKMYTAKLIEKKEKE